MLEPVFHRLILQDQDLFESEEGYQTLLQLLPKPAQAVLKPKWDEEPYLSSEDKWQDVEDVTDKKDKDRNYYVSISPLHRSLVTPLDIGGTAHDGRRQGRYHPPVHLPSAGRGSLETPKPLAESAVLHTPENWASVRARGSPHDRQIRPGESTDGKPAPTRAGQERGAPVGRRRRTPLGLGAHVAEAIRRHARQARHGTHG